MSEKSKEVLGHLGKVLLHISILGFIFCACSMFSKLIWLISIVVFTALVVIIVACTLGLSLTSSEIRNFIGNGYKFLLGENFNQLSQQINKIFPYVAIAVMVLMVVGIVFLALDIKNQKSKGSLIALSVLLGLLILVVISFYIFSVGGVK